MVEDPTASEVEHDLFRTVIWVGYNKRLFGIATEEPTITIPKHNVVVSFELRCVHDFHLVYSGLSLLETFVVGSQCALFRGVAPATSWQSQDPFVRSRRICSGLEIETGHLPIEAQRATLTNFSPVQLDKALYRSEIRRILFRRPSSVELQAFHNK